MAEAPRTPTRGSHLSDVKVVQVMKSGDQVRPHGYGPARTESHRGPQVAVSDHAEVESSLSDDGSGDSIELGRDRQVQGRSVWPKAIDHRDRLERHDGAR